MSCVDFQPYLKAWIDGELEEGRSAAVETHVSACPDCRAVAVDFRSLGRLLREAPEREAVPVDAGEIRRRAVEARRDEEGVIRLLQRAAAVAAAVLLVSAVFWVLPSSGIPDAGVAVSPPAETAETPDEDEALATFLSNLDSWPDAVAMGDY